MTLKQYRRVRYLAHHSKKARVRNKNYRRMLHSGYRKTFGICYNTNVGSELHLVYEKPTAFQDLRGKLGCTPVYPYPNPREEYIPGCRVAFVLR